MDSDAQRLFDAIGEHIDSWQSIEAAYRRHVARLLPDLFGPGRDPLDADMGQLADLMLHVVQLVAIHGCTHSLLGALEDWDNAEIARYELRPQPAGGSDSAEA